MLFKVSGGNPTGVNLFNVTKTGGNRKRGDNFMKSAGISSGKKLLTSINNYIEDCREKSDGKKPIFANVAGFCRYIGISVGSFMSLKKKYPDDFEIAGAYFEDAALNSGATATLVGLYLRQYGFWGQQAEDETVCDHDLYADGI